MTKKEFTTICQSIEEGQSRFVEDVDLHKTGKVLACEGNSFQVEVGGERQSWSSDKCRELRISGIGVV